MENVQADYGVGLESVCHYWEIRVAENAIVNHLSEVLIRKDVELILTVPAGRANFKKYLLKRHEI